MGSGDGRGYSLNLPVPAGSGEEVFCALVEHVVLPAARQFEPDLVLALGGIRRASRRPARRMHARDTSSFAELTRQVLTLGVPVGAVLEGGYDLGALADGVAATMEALTEGGEPGSHPVEPVTARAVQALGGYWDL